jgi:hypothetical protein
MIETTTQLLDKKIESRLFAQATIKERLAKVRELMEIARDPHFFRLDRVTADFLKEYDKLPETIPEGAVLSEMEQLFVVRALEIIEAKLTYELEHDRDRLLNELEKRDMSYDLLMNMAVRMLKLEQMFQGNL